MTKTKLGIAVAKKRHISQELTGLICEMYQTGVRFGAPRLAKIFGFSAGFILKTLRANGVPIRTSSDCQLGLRPRESSPRYHGGCTSSGYRRIYIGRKCVQEHRYIAEKHLGRQLGINEVVHHRDGNGLNNSIENLEVMSRAEHCLLHSPSLTYWGAKQ